MIERINFSLGPMALTGQGSPRSRRGLYDRGIFFLLSDGRHFTRRVQQRGTHQRGRFTCSVGLPEISEYSSVLSDTNRCGRGWPLRNYRPILISLPRDRASHIARNKAVELRGGCRHEEIHRASSLFARAEVLATDK